MRARSIIVKKILIGLILLGILSSMQHVKASPTITVPFSSQTVVVDGIVHLLDEYAQATSYSFGTRDGLVTMYFQIDLNTLYIGIDVDGEISYGEQIWMGFDINNDDVLDVSDDLWLLWHGDPHGDPDDTGEPWIRFWEGESSAVTSISGIVHDTKLRSGGYQTELSISMSFFSSDVAGFHIRHSPDSNIAYIWEVPDGTNVQSQYDDHDASIYGDVFFEHANGFSNLTTISLEPESIAVPFIDLGTGSLAFEIELKIYNVVNLKEFHIDFDYDSNVIEYIEGKIDRSFYLISHGGVGSPLDKLLATPFTGSATMYRYAFKVVGLGNTTITLDNPEFFDEDGIPIQLVTRTCTVSVKSFTEYADIQYSDLESQYLSLVSNYSQLEKKHLELAIEYDNLTMEYSELESLYNEILATNIELVTQYDELTTTIEELGAQYNALETQHGELQDEIKLIQSNNAALVTELDELKSELESLKNQGIPGFPYASIIIGMITGAIILWYLPRKQ